MLCDKDFIFIGGDSEVGVDSAELLIGDSEGMCDCVGLLKIRFGGGDGVTDLDSARRIYRSAGIAEFILLLHNGTDGEDDTSFWSAEALTAEIRK